MLEGEGGGVMGEGGGTRLQVQFQKTGSETAAALVKINKVTED